MRWGMASLSFAVRTFNVHKCTDANQKSIAKFQTKMESVPSQIPVVEVTVRDGSRSLWAAAVAPEKAVPVVAMLVPAMLVAVAAAWLWFLVRSC
jgi:hypothetical protein